MEKGGVNYSAIHGASLPASAATAFQLPENQPFFATGVSLVIHPRNPHVPTIHMNIRYFEAGELRWFGGGIDLTPYYPVRGDCIGFHQTLQKLCFAHNRNYSSLKEECDRYFLIRHRQEARGIGGIFFDHLRQNSQADLDFTTALGMVFPELYAPVLKNRDKPYGERERQFQGHRRSRYAEFNLVYDRGTLFGLQSGGRIESILMSMPPEARWIYDYQSEPGSPEAELEGYLAEPLDWASLKA
jgi:coproporphyrinogen III oxidase